MTSEMNDYIDWLRPTVEEVRAGIDWISASLRAEAPDRWVWANSCAQVVMAIAENGYAVSDRGLLGYRGIAAGNCFAGNREDGSYVQLSGAHAQTHLAAILRGDLHVSRVDLAVTVRFRVMPSALGEVLHRAAVEAVQSHTHQLRRRRIYYMSGNDGGYTLYIGSPASEQRARIYNKEIQSDTPEYERCWRFEVVYKNELAMEILEQVSAMPINHVPQLCSVLVWQWCALRGIPCPWNAAGDDYVLPISKTTPSDAAKKLQWVAKQVRPAVRWLIENGYRADLLDALGLEKPASDVM